MAGVSLAPSAANMSFSVDRDNLFFFVFFPRARTPSLPDLAALGKCRKNFIYILKCVADASRHVGTVSGEKQLRETPRFQDSDKPKVGNTRAMWQHVSVPFSKKKKSWFSSHTTCRDDFQQA